MTFEQLISTFLSLAGVGSLIAVLVNIGKTVGLVKDGQAANWSAGLNLAGLIALFTLQLLGKAELVPALDSQAGALASVLTALFGFIWQLIVSIKTHNTLKGTRVIGKSFSAERVEAFLAPSEYKG